MAARAGARAERAAQPVRAVRAGAWAERAAQPVRAAQPARAAEAARTRTRTGTGTKGEMAVRLKGGGAAGYDGAAEAARTRTRRGTGTKGEMAVRLKGGGAAGYDGPMALGNRWWVSLALLGCLAGCTTGVLHGLDEPSANEALATLESAGIGAE